MRNIKCSEEVISEILCQACPHRKVCLVFKFVILKVTASKHPVIRDLQVRSAISPPTQRGLHKGLS